MKVKKKMKNNKNKEETEEYTKDWKRKIVSESGKADSEHSQHHLWHMIRTA